MTHEPDIEKIVREGAKAGGREVKVKMLGRQMLLIYLFMVLAAAGAWHISIDYTNGVRHQIEKRLCVVLVPLLPGSSQEVPTSAYGERIVSGVKQGVQQNHCKVGR